MVMIWLIIDIWGLRQIASDESWRLYLYPGCQEVLPNPFSILLKNINTYPATLPAGAVPAWADCASSPWSAARGITLGTRRNGLVVKTKSRAKNCGVCSGLCKQFTLDENVYVVNKNVYRNRGSNDYKSTHYNSWVVRYTPGLSYRLKQSNTYNSLIMPQFNPRQSVSAV